MLIKCDSCWCEAEKDDCHAFPHRNGCGALVYVCTSCCLRFASTIKKRNTPRDEFYRTPKHIIELLLEKERFVGTIWEPCAGDGQMVDVLKEHGYKVQASDKKPRRSDVSEVNFTVDESLNKAVGLGFLTKRHVCDNIVTNPPFRIWQQIVRRALTLASGKVAMLLPAKHINHFEKQDICCYTRYHLIDGDVEFERVDKNPFRMSCTWFVWEPQDRSRSKNPTYERNDEYEVDE